jgi:colanic acid biosynthesis glycosyl transferase WcaI
MKITLITITYPPEIGGAAHLIYELAHSLMERGHDITVLTGFPHYNLEVTPPEYRRGWRMNEILDGIPVRRIRIPVLPRTSKVARGLEHFIFGLWLSILFMFSPKADVVLVFSPPLPLPWLVGWVGRLRRIPVVVNIQDLFPREAVELGMLTNPILIRIFEGMERQVHRLAAAITVHSPGNKEHVVEHGGKPEYVHVIYNWVDTERIQPSQRDNNFSLQYGLGNKFIVSYAGTMGWAQDMATIINSAAQLRNNQDILFLLVGDGVEKEKAQVMCQQLELENVLWLPMQPWSVYPEILSASDISLINLHPELRTPVVPSKLLSIMAAGRPVVASLPAESDARRIINEACCGICVDSGDGEALAVAIQKLQDDHVLASEMGLRGRTYVESNFSRDACIGKLESVLICLVEGGVK